MVCTPESKNFKRYKLIDVNSNLRNVAFSNTYLLLLKMPGMLYAASPFHIRNDCYYAENNNDNNSIS
jgi:hypothetical protein